MATPNSRIDIRISNPEKDVWHQVADEMGVTLTQLIKWSVRDRVNAHNKDATFYIGSGSTQTSSTGGTWTTGFPRDNDEVA